jgi:hypothetical protein
MVHHKVICIPVVFLKEMFALAQSFLRGPTDSLHKILSIIGNHYVPFRVHKSPLVDFI